jgi:hypothetical protein
MQLISGFFDVYLNLNEQENQRFKTTVDKMGLTDDEQEKYMEIVTSWEREAAEKIAINALRMGMTVDVTVQLTGLTVERVQELQTQLQKES